MPAPLLIVVASLLFSLMALCVKLASASYGTGEIVMYRGLIGMAVMAMLIRARGGSIRSPVPALHFWRGASGVASLCLWFYSLRGLPIATAMTLNYLSSVWMALLLIGSALVTRRGRVEPSHVMAVLAGFGGIALILRPSFDDHAYQAAAAGLASGLLAAQAYLQVQALGRAGEPELRVVFYFSLGTALAGMALTAGAGGPSAHSPRGLLLLAAIGLLAALAQLTLTRAYNIGQTLSNAALQYMGIVFSFGFGVWLFDDRVSAGAIAGVLLVIGAGLAASRAGPGTATPLRTGAE